MTFLILIFVLVFIVYLVPILKEGGVEVKYYFSDVSVSDWLNFIGLIFSFIGTIFLSYSSKVVEGIWMNGDQPLAFDSAKFKLGIIIIAIGFFIQILSPLVYFFSKKILKQE